MRANFRADIISQISQWRDTVLITMVTTIVVSFIGHIFLNILEGYEPCLAFLCCISGAQVEALALPRGIMDQDTVVALFHVVRVGFVFMPPLLPLLEGDVPLEASNIALRQGPAFLSLMLEKLQPLLLLRLEGFCLPNGAVFRCHIFWSVLTFSCDWLGGVATGSRICSCCPVCDWLRCRRLVG